MYNNYNPQIENDINSLMGGSQFPSAKPLLALEGVSVHYDQLKALQNINLEILKGEVVFITGASGAGKTTLMNILGGRLVASEGKRLSHLSEGELIAPIFQDLMLIQNQSLEKNLFAAYDRKLYSNRKNFIDDLNEFSRVLGIYDRLHLKVKDANGGLKQKVAFLRAMLAKPSVILADEPTSSLDYENAKKIFDILSLYNTKQGLTVVWASHNKDLVKRFNGRIIHLDKGKVIHSGHACFI